VIKNSASKAFKYFAQINYPFQEHINPAEHMMDLISIDMPINRTELDDTMDEQNAQQKTYQHISNLANQYNKLDEFKCNDSLVYQNLSNIKDYKFEQDSISWCRQLVILISREGLVISRSGNVMLFKGLIGFFLSVLMIVMYSKMKTINYKGFQNLVGYFMILCYSLITLGITNAFDHFCGPINVFLKEQASKQYSVTAYYFSYVLSTIPFGLFMPTIFMLFGYLIVFMFNGVEVTLKKAFTFCIRIYKG
jgi:hypothetical protein